MCGKRKGTKEPGARTGAATAPRPKSNKKDEGDCFSGGRASTTY